MLQPEKKNRLVLSICSCSPTNEKERKKRYLTACFDIVDKWEMEQHNSARLTDRNALAAERLQTVVEPERA